MSLYDHVPMAKCQAVQKHIESSDDTDGEAEVSVSQFRHSLSMDRKYISIIVFALC